jgi:hypothetical protein
MIARAWTRLKALPRDDSGVIALETVLVFPVQLLVTLVLLQLAHLFVAAQALQYAVYQGTRSAALSWDGNNTAAREQATRVAWVLLSPLHNPGGGQNTIAVLPGRIYHYPALETGRLTFTLPITPTAGLANDLTGMAEVNATETLFEGVAIYRSPLTVPLGGAFVHAAARWTKRTETDWFSPAGWRWLPMQQRSYFARPWPR